jgi:hypothetical protein
VDELLEEHLKERDVNARFARWFLGLTMLFGAMGLCTAAQAQVVVAINPHHHRRHYHHRHYYHHDNR